MPSSSKPSTSPSLETDSAVLNPGEIIEAMIDLRIQLAQIQRQIDTLQPTFYTACGLLEIEKITLQRAVITRRLTPGQWDYSMDILEQEALFKQLKLEFQELNEPVSGREVYWMLRLLLATS
jgi:hypothetical protein